MSHSHEDSQNHSHNHTHGANKKTLFISFLIITGYMIVEGIGGYVTNSLALLSDAGHMLSDSFSLGIALIAFIVSANVASYSKTYGYKRFEILAAVLNGVTLIGVAIFIFYEAIQRFANPPEVATTGMLIISSIGLLINLLVAWIMMFGGDTEENLNMRGAFLHVISDIVGSFGAIIAALLMIFFGWGWADPLASLIVAMLVLRSGFYVTKEAIHVLMEGTPKNIDVEKVIKTIQREEKVETIHDLHIWTITSGLVALSCHMVVKEDITINECEGLLHRIEHNLEHLGIRHVTIQIETKSHKHGDSILCCRENEGPHPHQH